MYVSDSYLLKPELLQQLASGNPDEKIAEKYVHAIMDFKDNKTENAKRYIKNAY